MITARNNPDGTRTVCFNGNSVTLALREARVLERELRDAERNRAYEAMVKRGE